MSADEEKGKENESIDMDAYLEERAKIDSVFKEKFARVISVMFTDLKGSTTITENEGDLAVRMMLKKHNDTLMPIIQKNKGTLVKTMGDGTMSYFSDPQNAVQAAVEFQIAMDRLNMEKTFKTPVLVRIGINTGEGIVEKNDIYGDVVNVASRFESSANPGEIYISETTYNGMADKTAIYCRFIKTTTLKGKSVPFKIYKAFWKADEIEADKTGIESSQQSSAKAPAAGLPPMVKLALFILIPILLVFLMMKGGELLKQSQPATEKRSLTHSAGGNNGGGK